MQLEMVDLLQQIQKFFGKIIELRNHGMTKNRNEIYICICFRMDNLQAAVLNLG